VQKFNVHSHVLLRGKGAKLTFRNNFLRNPFARFSTRCNWGEDMAKLRVDEEYENDANAPCRSRAITCTTANDCNALVICHVMGQSDLI